VRLVASVLMRLKNTQKSQQKSLCHLMRLMLMVPGRGTLRNLGRYSPYHGTTFCPMV
jgi:hypothetical protein